MIHMNLGTRQTSKTKFWLPRGEVREEGLGVWDWHVHTTTHGTDGQQTPAAQMGNSTQCSVITCTGEESDPKWLSIELNHCVIQQKL